MTSVVPIAEHRPAARISDRPKSAPADAALPFRQAPHNLEAEQALLGAIFVNNEAMDKVSSFLEAHHFFDPLHQQIFETAGAIIRAGKSATPITLRTFFERAEPISPNLTVPQYLGTLAANATTIINAEHYGRTVYDLATRRALIIMGEDMVTGAYDSAVDAPPAKLLDEFRGRIDKLSTGCSREPMSSARCLAAIEAQPIQWFWANRIALARCRGARARQISAYLRAGSGDEHWWPASRRRTCAAWLCGIHQHRG